MPPRSSASTQGSGTAPADVGESLALASPTQLPSPAADDRGSAGSADAAGSTTAAAHSSTGDPAATSDAPATGYPIIGDLPAPPARPRSSVPTVASRAIVPAITSPALGLAIAPRPGGRVVVARAVAPDSGARIHVRRRPARRPPRATRDGGVPERGVARGIR